METLNICLAPYLGGSSGIDTNTYELTLALKKKGHDVKICSTQNYCFKEEDILKYKYKDPKSYFHTMSYFLTYPILKRGATINRCIKNSHENFDVVHYINPLYSVNYSGESPLVLTAYAFPNDLLARLRIHTSYVKGLYSKMVISLVQTQYYVLDQIAFKKSNHIITHTEKLSSYFKNKGFSATCIPPCITLPTLEPKKESKNVNIFFGALDLNDKKKGLSYLLKSIEFIEKKHKTKIPYQLNLVGRYDQNIIETINKLDIGDKVKLYGLLLRADFIKILKESDILVFPSIHEEWGHTVTEALVLGIPIITFNTIPFNEIISKEIGILVPLRDTDSLSNAILTLINDKPLRMKMNKSAKEYAEQNYDWRIIIKKIEEVYRHTISKKDD